MVNHIVECASVCVYCPYLENRPFVGVVHGGLEHNPSQVLCQVEIVSAAGLLQPDVETPASAVPTTVANVANASHSLLCAYRCRYRCENYRRFVLAVQLNRHPRVLRVRVFDGQQVAILSDRFALANSTRCGDFDCTVRSRKRLVVEGNLYPCGNSLITLRTLHLV